MSAHLPFSRRSALALAMGGVLALGRTGRGQEAVSWPDWACAPIGWPGEVPGVGFRIGHGFAAENTWFAAGWWHTGEDWYAMRGDTAGASVYAVARGEVVYADFSYPGRVVIVQHADELYSMYGHLDPASVPAVGTKVVAGQQIGTVLQQADVRGPGQAPSHLHFEMRTFFMRDDVNGNAPQYGVNCGFQCPPGPGYWPQSASTHPVDHGWLNPTEAALGRIGPAAWPDLELVGNGEDGGRGFTLYAAPDSSSEVVGSDVGLDEIAGVAEVEVGVPDAAETSAEGYHVWASVMLGAGSDGWLQLAVPSLREQGADGRPSSVDRIAMFNVSDD